MQAAILYIERLQHRAWSLVILDGGLSADGKLLLMDQLATAPDRDAETRVLVSTADPVVAARARAAGFAVLPRPFLPRDLVSGLQR